MKKQILTLALSTAGLLSFYSCSKSNSSSTPQTEIVGTWKITKVQFDSTFSGLGINKTITNDTSWAHTTIVFNSNGTEVTTFYSYLSHNTWSFVNNNAYLKLTNTDSATGPTQYGQVISISATTLVIKDTATNQLDIETLTKQ